MTTIELSGISRDIDQRLPFVHDPSSNGYDVILHHAMFRERVEDELERKMRSLPLNQYLKEKRRIKELVEVVISAPIERRS